MANGTIKRLVRDRGFGFIRDDGGQEWFFHRSSVKAGAFEELNEGQRVSFDVTSQRVWYFTMRECCDQRAGVARRRPRDSGDADLRVADVE